MNDSSVKYLEKASAEDPPGMGEYKMIAVDMDGTLLDNQKQISKETVRAVRKLMQTEILFVISTGRPFQGVEKYKDLLDLRGPVIAYNGALIVDAGTSERLYEQGLSAKDAKKIFELGLCYDITMGIWARNRLYGNKLDERMRAYQMISGVEPVRIDAFEGLPAKDVTKIVWCGDPGCLKKITEELSGDLFAEVTCCLSQPSILEFFSSRVSKALAMQKIGERYGIRREEMLAVGDGLNDVEMLQYAGLGIAMDNAPDEVKKYAGWITASNEEEGVLRVLRHFFGV